MLGLSNTAGLVDIGFVVFVSLACLKSLTNSQSAGELVAERWRKELRELEKVLRGLIDEAGTASNQLDRRLQRRKQELETLLSRVETNLAHHTTSVASTQHVAEAARRSRKVQEQAPRVGHGQVRREERQATLSDETLHDSWFQDERKSTESDYFEESLPIQSDENLGALEDLLDEPTDTLSLSHQAKKLIQESSPKNPPKNITRTPLRARSKGGATSFPPKGLMAELEVEKFTEAERLTFSKLSIIDETAYKIARRLLSEGVEIHVVARKLDIPVSEVRLLDRLMREERDSTSLGKIGPNYKSVETIPSRKVVRPKVEKTNPPISVEKSRESAENTFGFGRALRSEEKDLLPRGQETVFELLDADLRQERELEVDASELDCEIEREIALL